MNKKLTDYEKLNKSEKTTLIVCSSLLSIFFISCITIFAVDVAKNEKAVELESKIGLVENKLNHKVDNLETCIIAQSSAIKYSFVDLFAKDCFVEWLELQSLDSDPYTVITVEYAKTEATTFGYEYYTAIVYYTTGNIKEKKFLFAFDPKANNIAQITEVL